MLAEALVTILFTLPTTQQARWTVFDPDLGDSVVVGDCESDGVQAIHQIIAARLYFNPVTGGGWRVIAQQGVAGLEGQTCEFTVDSGPGGHYYVTTTNPAGESCASNEIYIPGSVVTGIDPTTKPPHVTSVRTFDIQGRPIRGPTASGIYFRRVTYSDGTHRTQRFVHLK